MPSDAYMGQSTRPSLVQIMACCLVGTSHYLNQCCNIVNSNLRNKRQWNLKRNSYIFIQENAFENVVREMVAILSRLQWVDHSTTLTEEWSKYRLACRACFKNIAVLLIFCKIHDMLPTGSSQRYCWNLIEFMTGSLYENFLLTIFQINHFSLSLYAEILWLAQC